MPGQTVQTQIRLLLEEQSDQGLHCLPFRLHRLDSLLCGRAHSSNFRVITTNFLGVRIFRKFTVMMIIRFSHGFSVFNVCRCLRSILMLLMHDAKQQTLNTENLVVERYYYTL